jgi:hypothetical protein
LKTVVVVLNTTKPVVSCSISSQLAAGPAGIVNVASVGVTTGQMFGALAHVGGGVQRVDAAACPAVARVTRNMPVTHATNVRRNTDRTLPVNDSLVTDDAPLF